MINKFSEYHSINENLNQAKSLLTKRLGIDYELVASLEDSIYFFLIFVKLYIEYK